MIFLNHINHEISSDAAEKVDPVITLVSLSFTEYLRVGLGYPTDSVGFILCGALRRIPG